MVFETDELSLTRERYIYTSKYLITYHYLAEKNLRLCSNKNNSPFLCLISNPCPLPIYAHYKILSFYLIYEEFAKKKIHSGHFTLLLDNTYIHGNRYATFGI